jgi:hypothetical protein
MVHSPDVDPIARGVAADPFDPDDPFLEVHRHDQPIVVSLDVEDDAVARDDTGGSILLLHLRRARPLGPARLIEPSFQRRAYRNVLFRFLLAAITILPVM